MKQVLTDPAKGTGDMREVERAAEAGDPRALIALEAHRNEPIPIEVSAHHVHLAQGHVEALLGPGHQLTKQSDLSQPGHFASQAQLTIVGPKGRVERVRVPGDRELIFGDVRSRVDPNFRLAMHLDTDEANAANLETGVPGYLDGVQSQD